MKKFFLLLAASFALASCAITTSSVKTASISTPVFTASVASLQVAEDPITFTYTPSFYESKHSSLKMILENAQYQALKQHGGDVLIQLSYKVDGKGFGKFIRKIKTITISGYPAKYVDFRVPDENDRENIELFYNKNRTIINVKKNN